ncbi:efflux transporter outer membrane subunit [uncultured Sphingomonas sp.]|uniref:efflux transporter outer membrane subunit n=1 Tax=uncultured Sphingomonas sp. TaxID=158754 RepID=UPI0035CA7E68
MERQALGGVPTLAAPVARIDAARAGLRGVPAEQLPSVNASGSVVRQRFNPGAQFGGGLPDGIAISPNRTNFNTGIDASFDVDLFGRLRASRRAAAARLDAAGADAAGVRLSLSADTARAVVDVRTLDLREAVVRRDIASAADLVAVTRVRARAGVAPEFDLVRAQSLEAEAQGRIEPIRSERAGATGRLVTLTGVPAQEVLALLAAPAGPPLSVLPPLGLPSVLLRARPDVAAAERRLAAADQQIAAAVAGRYPRLSITAALGLFSLGLGSLFDDDAIIGSVGPGLAGPLLDFGRVGARIDARQADVREAFANYRDALFTALGDTEAALGQVAAADARAVVLERQAFLDRDAAGLARERYRRGLDTFLTVIDAERSANNSNTNAIDARGEVSRARIALYRAVGGEGEAGR